MFLLVIVLTFLRSGGTGPSAPGDVTGGGDWTFSIVKLAVLNVNLVSRARFITPLTARDRRRRCWRHRGLGPRKQAVRIMFILLVLVGDVELNPGPIHPSECRPCYRYPCTICAKPVKSNQHGIECSKCLLWTHRCCCRMSIDTYNSLDGIDWFCPSCISLELPFASVPDIPLSPTPTTTSSTLQAHTSHVTTRLKPGFQVLHVNVRSLIRSLWELKELTIQYQPDIFALTETWLDSSVSNSELAIPNYSLVRLDRNRHGGGMAIYLKASLDYHHLSISGHNSSLSSLESMWLSVSGPTLPSPIALGVCYRPPSSLFSSVNCLFNEIEEAITLHKRVIVCGDININVLAKGSLTKRFTDLLQSYGLHQVIPTPTRVTPTSSSLIDIIAVDDPTAVIDAGTLNFAISDHLLCYATLNWKPSPHTKPNTTYSRQLKNLDVPAFLHDLQSVPWSIMDIFDDPSDKLEIFNHLFKIVLDLHVPLCEMKPRKIRAPWITHELRKLMKKRNRLHRRFL